MDGVVPGNGSKLLNTCRTGGHIQGATWPSVYFLIASMEGAHGRLLEMKLKGK